MGKVLLRTFGDKTFPTCRQFAYDKLIGAPSNFYLYVQNLFFNDLSSSQWGTETCNVWTISRQLDFRLFPIYHLWNHYYEKCLEFSYPYK